MNKKLIPLFLIALALTTNAMPMTPLHVVARAGHADYIRPIITSGIPVDIRNGQNHTPLHLAAYHGHLECVRGLLGLGANVFAQDCYSAIPLHLAALQGNSAIVNILMEHRAKRKEQLLQDFAGRKDEAFIKELIAAETDIDIKDINGCTPLHCAAITGSVACVRTLVEHGANVHALNKNGRNPKDAAVVGYCNPNLVLAIREGNLTNEVNYAAVIAYLNSKMAEEAHE